MSNVNALLEGRFSKKKPQKMNELAKRSNAGQLSSFSGVFKVEPLSDDEQHSIENILLHYTKGKNVKKSDLSGLATITSELKAINNQAIILHGERIAQAQTILKNYKDGAFTAWLIMTYGNRQTPYNFLQYYHLYQAISPEIRGKLETLPKQALYTLASRDGDIEQKEAFIESYRGEPKHIVIEQIRKTFPLARKDRRRPNLAKTTITQLKKVKERLQTASFAPSMVEKTEINLLLSQLFSLVNVDEEQDGKSLHN